jgi:peptidoglycan/xylan/chitin deacetylase (PgdA/CDA1 family)
MSAVFSCSVDDGHPSDIKVAELLSKHGLQATFFIPIKNREGREVLAPPQIREIGQKFEIGSHTYDHCYLNSVDLAEAQYQVSKGKHQLEAMLGKQVTGFCYPGGKYGPNHVAMVQATGFRYARTTMNLCFEAGQQAFEMPTTYQFYPHPRNVYLRNFAKAGNWSRRHEGLRLALLHSNWIERLYALFDHACEHDSVFHLWGHTKDIEELNAWQELDRFLAHVASRTAPQDRITNEQLAERFQLH